jgi:hypothetical protein
MAVQRSRPVTAGSGFGRRGRHNVSFKVHFFSFSRVCRIAADAVDANNSSPFHEQFYISFLIFKIGLIE